MTTNNCPIEAYMTDLFRLHKGNLLLPFLASGLHWLLHHIPVALPALQL